MEQEQKYVQKLNVDKWTSLEATSAKVERVVHRETKSTVKGLGLSFTRSSKETAVIDCDKPKENE